jgi:hypothetical protein
MEHRPSKRTNGNPRIPVGISKAVAKDCMCAWAKALMVARQCGAGVEDQLLTAQAAVDAIVEQYRKQKKGKS